MKMSITRRAFFGRFTIVAGFMATRAHVLRIAVAGGARRPADQRSMGLALGVEEAAHAASLFGGAIEIVAVDATDVSAVITGSCDAVAARGVPTLNIGCASDNVRRQCHPMLFHVTPSDAMRRDAAAQGSARVVAWDASLARFGADTLNQRFLKRFGQPMTEDAWIAWMAVKVLWEASIRTRSTEPAALAEFLARPTTQFDGHKGRPLSFRAWDHQLRQPLYVVGDGRLIEVPAATSRDSSTRAILDQLGERSSEASCAR